MVSLINMRLLDGRLATLKVQKQDIVGLTDQDGLLPGGAAMALEDLADFSQLADDTVVDCRGELMVPGMIDAHVHSRDPGFPEKETWQTLARAAFKGGVVAVCDMPNNRPPTVDVAAFADKVRLAAASGLDFKLYLGVGGANIARLDEIVAAVDPHYLCGLKVYYGQSTGEMMFADLDHLAAKLRNFPDLMITFHAEDQQVIDENSTRYPLVGSELAPEQFRIHSQIRCQRAAVAATRRILAWAEGGRRPINIAHVATCEEAQLIAAARARGVPVTCEIAPQHLWFSDNDYKRLGGFLKVNPPVRDENEVALLGEAFRTGLFDLFATDHAPHTLDEKKIAAYQRCPSGLPAIEFFVPLLLTLGERYQAGKETLLALGAAAPARVCGFKRLGALAPGFLASFVWVRRRASRPLAADEIAAHCGWSPYCGENLDFQVQATWHRGERVYFRFDKE